MPFHTLNQIRLAANQAPWLSPSCLTVLKALPPLHSTGAVPTPEAASRSGSAMVPSVTRALALLDLLAQERAPMSLARLSGSLGLPKSSVHALCATMVTLGYLRRQGEAGFFIGPRVMPLADAFVSGTDVAQAFNAVWEDMGAPPEETVILSVLNGSDVVYVAARSGVRPLGPGLPGRHAPARTPRRLGPCDAGLAIAPDHPRALSGH